MTTEHKELWRPTRIGHYFGLSLEVCTWVSLIACFVCPTEYLDVLVGAPFLFMALILLVQAAGVELFPGTRIGGGDLMAGMYYRRPTKTGGFVGGVLCLTGAVNAYATRMFLA